MSELRGSDAAPDAAQRAALEDYRGWGGAAGALDPNATGAISEVGHAAAALLSDEEQASVRASTLTAFYTPMPVARALWRAAASMGFGKADADGKPHDHVLEPGCGTGAFMRAAEDEGLALAFDGVEVDRVSAEIAGVLSPSANIVNAALEDCRITPGSYDLVVGNVPFSDALRIKAPDGRGTLPIHDAFIEHAVSALRPGGLALLITSRHTLDKRSDRTREWVAARADLEAAVRLPKETFSNEAGTEAVSDVLVLRRTEGVRAQPLPRWAETVEVAAPDGSTVSRSAWFADHPELVVGTQAVALGRYGFDTEVVSGLTADEIAERLTERLEKTVARLADAHERMGEREAEPTCLAVPQARDLYEYVLDGQGRVWYGDAESVEPVEGTPAELARLAALVGLRDQLRDTLALERTSEDEGEVERAIAELDRGYEAFQGRFGHICESRNTRAWKKMPDIGIAYLRSLEVTDSQGAYVGKGEALAQRVQAPIPPMPESARSAEDALAISLDRRGKVDIGLIARLLDTTEEGATEALGERVVLDPDTRGAVLAAEYLSGDVRAKLAHVEDELDKAEGEPARQRRRDWLEEAGIGAGALLEPSTEPAELKLLMRDVGGAWEVFCDPVGAATAVDTEAAWSRSLSRMRGSGSLRYMRPDWRIGATRQLLSDLRPGCSLTRPDGQARGPWQLMQSSLWANGYNANRGQAKLASALFLLRRAIDLGPDTVGDGALAAAIRPYPWYAEPNFAVKTLYGLTGVAIPEGREPEDWAQAAGKAARALREDPEILDYLTAEVAAAEHERAEEIRKATMTPYGPRYSEPDEIVLLAGRKGLERFRERRRAFEEGHPLEVDRERVEELRGLKRRLEEALPDTIGAEDIAMELGAPWIPPATYLEFAREVFKLDEAAKLGEGDANALKTRWRLARCPETGGWRFERAGAPEVTPLVAAEYSGGGMNPIELMQSAMNGSTISITKTETDADGKPVKVKDPVATSDAYRARDKICAAFRQWCMADPSRAGMLAGIYNERLNNLVPRGYDGSYLTLPGSNPSIELRPHQLDAVARVLSSEEGTLLAHVVGAGKTYATTAAVMEARRLGRAKKPLIAVPNHLTEQWASDILELYPTAKVLYMTKADMKNQDATRLFWARAATGDWDAVVVAQSRFDMLHVSPERRAQALEGRIEELTESLASAKAEGNSFSVKQLEAVRAKCRQRVKALSESQGTTDGMSFEELGFDMLCVDEAHNYKNLAVMGRSVAGMSSSASAKCENLLEICDCLRDAGHGGNIVFATGTPVSNTMSELYNMQRYLAPEVLKRQGTRVFSDWAQTFGETVRSVELRPEGKGFQVKERFARFHNLPELMAGYHLFADLVTNDDIDLDLPEVAFETVAVDASGEQKALVEGLATRAERVREGSVDPADDNMLKITHEGRALALSPRLLEEGGGGAPYGHDTGKLAACADKVAEVWERTAKDRGTQLVFCDASTPARGGWNVYGEIKALLVERGIPEGEIAFVHDAGSDPNKRAALFSRVSRGEVRVLLGSTAKLGTGTNVQERLAAIHDVDCPWRPADLEQRLGRIRRQGNMFSHVEDFRYVTTGTFDSYLYQTVERKQRFISQVFTNRSPVRSCDDLDETVLDYATVKAVASGDPAVRERLMRRNRIEELDLGRRAWARSREQARERIATQLAPEIENLKKTLTIAREDAPVFAGVVEKINQASANKDNPTDIVIGGTTYTGRKEAATAISEAVAALPAGTREATLGSYYGLTLGCKMNPGSKETYLYLECPRRYECRGLVDLSNARTVRQLEETVKKQAVSPAALEERLASRQERLAELKEASVRPWEHQEEYDRLTQLEAEAAAAAGEDVATAAPEVRAEQAQAAHAAVQASGHEDNVDMRQASASVVSTGQTVTGAGAATAQAPSTSFAVEKGPIFDGSSYDADALRERWDAQGKKLSRGNAHDMTEAARARGLKKALSRADRMATVPEGTGFIARVELTESNGCGSTFYTEATGKLSEALRGLSDATGVKGMRLDRFERQGGGFSATLSTPDGRAQAACEVRAFSPRALGRWEALSEGRPIRAKDSFEYLFDRSIVLMPPEVKQTSKPTAENPYDINPKDVGKPDLGTGFEERKAVAAEACFANQTLAEQNASIARLRKDAFEDMDIDFSSPER